VALTAYLRVVGTKQGEIRGSVTQKGREGRIAVIAMSHEFLSPRDASTGMAAGKRQHKPLSITKEIDRASTGLRTMLIGNEAAKEWELRSSGRRRPARRRSTSRSGSRTPGSPRSR